MLVEVMQIVIDPEAVQHSRVAEACYEIMGVESYRYVLHYCHGAADSGICGEEPVYLCTAEADFILCLYEPVPTSERMMRNYLRRGYEFYLNADTAVVQRSITSDVNNMYALILALLQLLSDTVVSLLSSATALSPAVP